MSQPVLKKVDARVRVLAERAATQGHRSLFVIVGDHGRDQVVNLHFMMQRLTAKKGNGVLWCYKKELGFSSDKKKRSQEVKQSIHKNQYSQQVDDPFQLFLASNDIRFCYYKETDKILGRTFSMCVLQDFEALTPNVLCRTIETVEGGGMVVILLKTMSSLKQLYQVTMDAHKKFDLDIPVEPRFNERFLLSLADCKSCLIMDDEMNILALSNATLDHLSSDQASSSVTHQAAVSVPQSAAEETATAKLATLAKTSDQTKVITSLAEAVCEKAQKLTIALTAGRGRGKSAALGLAVAGALSEGYSNIVITAPGIENVQTVFEFVLKGLKTLGFKEHLDYSISASTSTSNADQQHHSQQQSVPTVSKIVVYRSHRQSVSFHSAEELGLSSGSLGICELLVVDEAAAIPLPVVKRLMSGVSTGLTLLSSTVQGYEGTGRALALKLIQDMKKSKTEGRMLRELTMTIPIRYSANDEVEKWLHSLLCLSDEQENGGSRPGLTNKIVMPNQCRLYLINRDTLFSYHNASESFLRRMVSLFVSSHYKNTPNDLLLMADAPKHHLLVLLPPVEPNTATLPDIYVAIQIAVEGAIAPSDLEEFAQRGVVKPAGDMIPWTLSQQFHDTGFGQLNGIRIVRIATHPSLDKKGYGSEAVAQLVDWLAQQSPATPAATSASAPGRRREETKLSEETLAPRTNLAPLLEDVRKAGSLYGSEIIDYVGTSFGVTLPLFNFWSKNEFRPLYVRQSANEVTGEHSCIMLKPLRDNDWTNALRSDFTARFLRLLGGGSLSKLPVQLALSMLADSEGKVEPTLPRTSGETILNYLSRHDIHRLELYANNVIDHYVISDLVPVVAELVVLRRIGGLTGGISPVQQAILLALGAQRKPFEVVASELELPVSQVLAMFNKTMSKVSTHFNKMLIEATRAELAVSDRKIVKTVLASGPKESLSAEQEKTGKVVKAEMAEKRRKLLEEQKTQLEKKFAISGALDDVQISGERVQVRKEKPKADRPLEDERSKKKTKKNH